MLDSGGWRKAVPGKSALEHRAQKRQQEKPPVTEKSEMLLLLYLSVPWEDQCEQGPAVPAGRGLRKVFWVREEPQQGSAGTPWSFTRVGGTARDRAAAPAEPPGPLLCPVSAAGASPGLAGAGWWHRDTAGPLTALGTQLPLPLFLDHKRSLQCRTSPVLLPALGSAQATCGGFRNGTHRVPCPDL